MKILACVLGLAFAATPALAETIAPPDAQKYIGKTVTVEGVVATVHHAVSGKVTFIDIGGRYPDNAFTGIILADDAAKFPDVDKLEGKTIDITGTITLYNKKPEIILKDATQIKTK